MPIFGAPFSIYAPASIALIALVVMSNLHMRVLALFNVDMVYEDASTSSVHAKAAIAEGRILARRAIETELTPRVEITQHQPVESASLIQEQEASNPGGSWFRGPAPKLDNDRAWFRGSSSANGKEERPRARAISVDESTNTSNPGGLRKWFQGDKKKAKRVASDTDMNESLL